MLFKLEYLFTIFLPPFEKISRFLLSDWSIPEYDYWRWFSRVVGEIISRWRKYVLDFRMKFRSTKTTTLVNYVFRQKKKTFFQHSFCEIRLSRSGGKYSASFSITFPPRWYIIGICVLIVPKFQVLSPFFFLHFSILFSYFWFIFAKNNLPMHNPSQKVRFPIYKIRKTYNLRNLKSTTR